MNENGLIPGQRVAVDESTPVRIGPRTDNGEPANVEIIRNGEEIAMIVVTCDCGKRIQIACQY